MGDAPTRRDPTPGGPRWAAIRARLDAASGALAVQGSVAWRATPGGTRVASVRFVEVVDGRRRQRAVYLGTDATLVRRARRLIRGLRERERQVREVEEAARFVAGLGAFLRRSPSTRPPKGTRGGEA